MLTQYLTTACNISFLSTTNERERERGRERTTHCCCVPKKALIECHALKKDLTRLIMGPMRKGPNEFTTPTLVPFTFWNETSFWQCLTREIFRLKFED
jgi:hypothetical protein